MRMCMQKCARLPLLTPNQTQTCVASHWKSSFTWNISVSGHCVMTAPSPHTELTLSLLLLISMLILLSFLLSSAHLIFIAGPTWE